MVTCRHTCKFLVHLLTSRDSTSDSWICARPLFFHKARSLQTFQFHPPDLERNDGCNEPRARDLEDWWTPLQPCLEVADAFRASPCRMMRCAMLHKQTHGPCTLHCNTLHSCTSCLSLSGPMCSERHKFTGLGLCWTKRELFQHLTGWGIST